MAKSINERVEELKANDKGRTEDHEGMVKIHKDFYDELVDTGVEWSDDIPFNEFTHDFYDSISDLVNLLISQNSVDNKNGNFVYKYNFEILNDIVKRYLAKKYNVKKKDADRIWGYAYANNSVVGLRSVALVFKEEAEKLKK